MYHTTFSTMSDQQIQDTFTAAWYMLEAVKYELVCSFKP